MYFQIAFWSMGLSVTSKLASFIEERFLGKGGVELVYTTGQNTSSK